MALGFLATGLKTGLTSIGRGLAGSLKGKSASKVNPKDIKPPKQQQPSQSIID